MTTTNENLTQMLASLIQPAQLHPTTVKTLVNALGTGLGAMPSVCAADPEEYSVWKKFNLEVRMNTLDLETHAGDGKFVEFILREITDEFWEIVINSHTNSLLPYLAKFDGLKKRTWWPKTIYVSNVVTFEMAKDVAIGEIICVCGFSLTFDGIGEQKELHIYQ
jgi:hypothetical protein